MPRVLVIEDEDTLRTNVVRGLSKIVGIDVVGAATLGEALASIDETPPDAILSDLDLPDRPGVELIGELGRRGLRCPVTFVSAYTRAFAAQIPRHAGVQVVDKPAPLEQLREIIRGHLEAAGSMQSSAPFGVADYLQLACMGRHSVSIEITGRGHAASVVVHRGQLWNAHDARGSGEEAFRRLLRVRGANVSVQALHGDPGEREIMASWEALLLDAARVEDEEGAGAAFSDGLVTGEHFALSADDALEMGDTQPSASAEQVAFEAACEEGVLALLHKDYAAALKSFRTAERQRPDDKTVQANLARLREMGVSQDELAEDAHE